MPEGDTVHKLAAALRPALLERPVEAVWLRDRGVLAPLAGLAVRDVAALGKHLLVALGRPEARRPAWVLHVHLGMRGRWHRFARDASRPPGAPAPGSDDLRIDTREHRHVCCRAAVAEVLRAVDVALHPALSRLGPDLLAPAVPFGRIAARARRRARRSAAELLLDQSVACGLGNVYKSEVLFLEGVHPRTPAARLADAELEALYRRAATLLAWNLGGWRRTTLRRVEPGHPPRRGEPRLWVYGREGEPCRRCGARIRSARLGDDARSTFWCPRCQPAPRPDARPHPAAAADGPGPTG